MGIFPQADVERDLEVLAPGQAWQYRLRVLYADEAPTRLAFEERGRYWVKVSYPLITPQPPGSRDPFRLTRLESNAIEVVVKEPQGIDAKVWQTIRAPAFLHFLQAGFGPELSKDIPLRAAELVDSIAESSYHDGLRWALAEFYLRYAGMPETRLDEEEKRLIERALSPEDLRRIRERRGERAAPETR